MEHVDRLMYRDVRGRMAEFLDGKFLKEDELNDICNQLKKRDMSPEIDYNRLVKKLKEDFTNTSIDPKTGIFEIECPFVDPIASKELHIAIIVRLCNLVKRYDSILINGEYLFDNGA